MKRKMINPISYVKNTRVSYSKFLEKNIKEVLVQFDTENPAWIPYDTLIAIDCMKNASKEETYCNSQIEGKEFDKSLQEKNSNT
mgnify:CR=1 FL=1